MTIILIFLALVIGIVAGRYIGSWMLRINEVVDLLEAILHELRKKD